MNDGIAKNYDEFQAETQHNRLQSIISRSALPTFFSFFFGGALLPYEFIDWHFIAKRSATQRAQISVNEQRTVLLFLLSKKRNLFPEREREKKNRVFGRVSII